MDHVHPIYPIPRLRFRFCRNDPVLFLRVDEDAAGEFLFDTSIHIFDQKFSSRWNSVVLEQKSSSFVLLSQRACMLLLVACWRASSKPTMNFYFRLTILGLSAMLSLAQTNGTCPLTCQNGAKCVPGGQDYSGQPTNPDGTPFWFQLDTNRSDYHCACPANFTGLRCGRPYVICPNTNLYCYHGGTCIPGLEKTLPANQLYCNCTNAQYDGIPYIGQYCQHKVAVKCDKAGDYFCLNEGKCKPNYYLFPNQCICPSGYRGPHCEFKNGQIPPCNLTCQNGGTCKLGLNNYDIALFADVTENPGDFTSCQCAPGYSGDLCQNKTVCPPGQHICLNGGTCTNNTGKVGSKCDCVGAYNLLGLSPGLFCNSGNITFCTHNRMPSASNKAFCLNNGHCKGLVNHTQNHLGCYCPDSFSGSNCEIYTRSTAASPTGSAAKKSSHLGGALSILYIVLAVLVVVYIIALVQRKRARKKLAMTPVSQPNIPYHDCEPSGPTPFESEGVEGVMVDGGPQALPEYPTEKLDNIEIL